MPVADRTTLVHLPDGPDVEQSLCDVSQEQLYLELIYPVLKRALGGGEFNAIGVAAAMKLAVSHLFKRVPAAKIDFVLDEMVPRWISAVLQECPNIAELALTEWQEEKRVIRRGIEHSEEPH